MTEIQDIFKKIDFNNSVYNFKGESGPKISSVLKVH